MSKITGPEVNGPKWRNRNRRMLKLSRERLEDAVAAHDRIMEVSTEIRARAGLPPLEDSEAVRAARAKLASSPARRKPAKAKGAPAPADPVAALERRRRAHEREAEAIRREAVEMFREKIAGATKIGRALGVKRQRVYQLAEEVAA